MAATLYRIKPRFQRALEPTVVALEQRRVSADSVTWVGLALAAAGGALALGGVVWRPALLAIPFVFLARMAANAVDGQLARRMGPTSRGAVLNEVCDVAGDAVAYIPFAFLIDGPASWLVVAVVAAGLVAEMAAVAGEGPRRNAGPLGKSDRALAFAVLAVALASGVPTTVVGGALGVMVGMALLTIRNRMRGL